MPKGTKTALRLVLFAALAGCIVSLILMRPFVAPVLASSTMDLGALDAGTVTHAKVAIINSSFRAVRIKRVTSACQCTLASGIPEVLRARSSYDADVTIRVKDMEGPATWSIAVEYGDGQRAIHTFKGSIVRPVPNEVVFPEYKQGEKGSKSFYFHSTDGSPAEIERLRFDEGYFEVHTEPVIGAAGEVKVVISESKSIPMGGFDKFLTLTAKSGGSETNRTVTLRGMVTPPLVSEPTRVVDTFQANLATLKRTIRLRAPYGGTIKLIGCRVEPSHLADIDLSSARVDADSSILLPITFRRSAGAASCVGSITLQGVAGDKRGNVSIDFYLAVPRR